MNMRRFSLQKGGSQEHICLITIFTVQVIHKINSIQILVCILWLAISRHVYFEKKISSQSDIFFFNSWLSFQRLCRLLWGYHFHFVDSNRALNNSVIPVPSWHVCLFWFPRRRQPPWCIGLFNWQTVSCRHLEVLGMSIPSCKPLKQLCKQHD